MDPPPHAAGAHMNAARASFPLALLALLALLAVPAPTLAAGPTYGEHGMALFGGKDGLYASHLPMFHAPHDYQVVLQLHVADARLDAALKRRLDGKTALWTVAPEKFDLDRLSPGATVPLRQFKQTWCSATSSKAARHSTAPQHWWWIKFCCTGSSPGS